MFAQQMTSYFVDRLGWLLVHSIWQFAFVGLAAAVLLSAMRRCSATARYQVLLAALGLMTLAPVCTWPLLPSSRQPVEMKTAARVGMPDDQPQTRAVPARPLGVEVQPLVPESRLATEPLVATLPVAPSVAQQSRWQPVTNWWHGLERAVGPWLKEVVVLWCTGVIVFALRPLWSWWTVRRLRRIGLSAAPPSVQQLLQRTAARLGVRKQVDLFQSILVQAPAVVGYFRPVILLPVSIVSGMPVAQLEAVLAHELAHVRRHDYLVNLLQTLIETVYFYHPAVWWVSRQIRVERENCCDDMAIRVVGSTAGYGHALLALEELRGSPASFALSARGGSLLARVRRIAGYESSSRLSSGASAGGAMLVVLLIAGALWTALAADEQPNNGLDLTPSEIADRIEHTMRRFDKVEYVVEYTEFRHTNPRERDTEPVVAEVSGTFRYVGDGERWLVDDQEVTTQPDSPLPLRLYELSGFDGQSHFVHDRRQFTIGEDRHGNTRFAPRQVFWNGAYSADWLLNALRHFTARVDRRETIGGYECVVVTSEPGTPLPGEEGRVPRARGGRKDNVFRYEVTLSPDQSWLPLKAVVYQDDRLDAEEWIDDLEQTDQGVWYPRSIRRVSHADSKPRRHRQIASFELREQFEPDEFRHAPPLGSDVIDYRSARAWHNDPWWPDLENLGLPQPTVSGLSRLASFADASMDGQPAPPVEVSEWIQGQWEGWDRADRQATMLIFIGDGGVGLSTAERMAGLKLLRQAYGRHGVEILCIASSSADPAVLRQMIRSLDIPFPLAIDSSTESGEGRGRSYAAYGISGYSSVFVIDSDGSVRIVDQHNTPDRFTVSPLEHVLRSALADRLDGQPAIRSGDRLERTRIAAEWKRLRSERVGSAAIVGRARIDLDRSRAGASGGQTEPVGIRAVPFLRILQSDVPGGHTISFDQLGAVETQSNAQGNFALAGLLKGEWQVTFTAPGMATVERSLILAEDDSVENLEVVLNQGNTLRGVVVDELQRPIGGASVKATMRHYNPDGELLDPAAAKRSTTGNLPREAVITGVHGTFELSELFEGAYTLEISAPGYVVHKTANVLAGTDDLQVVLQKESSVPDTAAGEEPAVIEEPAAVQDPAVEPDAEDPQGQHRVDGIWNE
jgi:beta-lactamase regulating signal transducer with metallopeptidase domain